MIDTSSRRGVVGLAVGDALTEVTLDETRRHARDLSAVCGQLLTGAGLKPKDLAAVYVGIGPGSYTGLRVGLMTAKTLAYALGCEFVTVPTFAALAHGTAGSVTVVADALQGCVYRQDFADGRALNDLKIVRVEEVTGADVLGTSPVPTLAVAVRPVTAAGLLAAGRTIRPLSRAELSSAEPLYLRGSSAEEKLKVAQV